MPTSTATIKRDDLIKRALRRIGIHYPNPTQMAQAIALLNDIMKELDVEGRWLFAIVNLPVYFATITGQRSYAVNETLAANRIASDILRVEWAEVVQAGAIPPSNTPGASSLRPLRVIYELESLSNIQREAVGGEPYFLYLEKRPTMAAQRIHLFPTPGGIYNIQYTYQRRLYDFAAANDNPDMPQDWDQKLVKRLAYELGPEYGLSLEERQELRAEMEDAMRRGKAANSEDPTPRPQRSNYY